MIARLGRARPTAVVGQETSAHAGRVAHSARGAKPSRTSSSEGRLIRLIGDLERQRQRIDHAIARAAGGAAFSPAQLVALQAQVYRYSTELEVISRVVDRTVGAVKTAINTPA